MLCDWSVKRMAIFIMCHISEFHEIKDFNYRRIGDTMHVEFRSTGDWFLKKLCCCVGGEVIHENLVYERS